MKNKTYLVDLEENYSLKLVKEYLKDLGYSDKVEIKRYLDKNILKYEIYNYVEHQGKETRVLKKINCGDYMELLRKVFEKEDNIVLQISPVIKNDRVSFNIAYSYQSSKTYRK